MDDKYNMNSHKLLWHLDRLLEYQKGNSVVPLNVQLGITNGCNFDCIYCYGAAVMGKVGVVDRIDLPFDTIINFLNDAKNIGVRSISLVGEGENTIHPNFYEIMNHTRKIDLNMGMATNGIALDKDSIKSVLESLIWLRFSVGGIGETYELIHGRNVFNRFVDIVRSTVDIKRFYGLKTTIGLQMVVMNENIDDIVPLAKLGRELGVNYFVAKPCSDTPDRKLSVPHEEYPLLTALFNEAESYSTDYYSVVMKRSKFENKGYNDFDCCRATNFVIQINAKGNVAPCGHLLGYRADEFLMGNINKQHFSDIVFSDRYREIQAKVRTLDVNKECETNCLHYYMNNFLQGLENVPEHVNFV